MKINEKLKQIRNDNNISTYELSELTGISQSTISKLENGKRKMDFEALQKIADALGVPLDYLTRRSAKAIIEDNLEKVGMTFEELAEKTNLPISFFNNMDDITPENEGDYISLYKSFDKISEVLNIKPEILRTAIARQEPPIYDGPYSNAYEDFGGGNEIKEESSIYTTDGERNVQPLELQEIQLLENYNKLNNLGKEKLIDYSNDLIETPKFTIKEENSVISLEEAKEYLKKFGRAAYGGDNNKDMSDERIIELAMELKHQFEGKPHKYKK